MYTFFIAVTLIHIAVGAIGEKFTVSTSSRYISSETCIVAADAIIAYMEATPDVKILKIDSKCYMAMRDI